MVLSKQPSLEQNAMKTLSRFVAKFTNLIVAVLSCFDRVIFKRHLLISNGQALGCPVCSNFGPFFSCWFRALVHATGTGRI